MSILKVRAVGLNAQANAGWTWQYFNLDNGQSFTLASFITGPMDYTPPVIYGYFLNPIKDGTWEATYLIGENELLSPKTFSAIIGKTRYKKTNTKVDIPMVRAYKDLVNPELTLDIIKGVATPWCAEGTFNGASWGLIGEFAVDYTDLSGNYANGGGFMESIGFEKVEDYRAFALEFLKKGAKPSNTPKWNPRQR